MPAPPQPLDYLGCYGDQDQNRKQSSPEPSDLGQASLVLRNDQQQRDASAGSQDNTARDDQGENAAIHRVHAIGGRNSLGLIR